MTALNRKTEFWKINTPEKVGPGSYNLQGDNEIKPSSAPFSTTTKRNEPLKKSEVGPGSYLGVDLWDYEIKGASMLLSSSPRMGPFNAGANGFKMLTNVHNPGPGTYETETVKKSSKSSYHRHSLSIDPSPSSIPSKEIKEAVIGPCTYNPSYEKVKLSSAATIFGNYQGKRAVFEPQQDGPGPGDYIVEVPKGKSVGFTKSDKNAKNKINFPGPGAYEQPTERKIRKEPVESFGVLAKKNIMLSKDPHRPVQVGYSEVPPVGTYDTQDKLKAIERLKQKFISYESPIQKPGFNVNSKREMKWVDNPNFPGPGLYTEAHIQHEKTESIPFTSKVEKFHKLSTFENPGPGTYEREKSKPNTRNLSVFVSNTSRFNKIANDKLNVNILGYQPNVEINTPHQGWKSKQNRAFDTVVLKPNLSFESTANRFYNSKKDPNNPGPGHYEVRPKTVSVKSKRTDQRFGVFENYRPKTGTSQNIGPGSYSVENGRKKNFNMSGELAKVRPWI
jgi:Sperm-tail PG-rich repeat